MENNTEHLEEEIFIPEAVVNKEAYIRFITIKEGFFYQNRNEVVTSTGSVIDIKMPAHSFKARIVNLPDLERKKLFFFYFAFRRVLGTISFLKRDAYGVIDKKTGQSNMLTSKKADVIAMFGQFYTPQEVKDSLQEKYGVTVAHPTLHKFRIKYLKEIEDLQADYKKSHADIRLGYKRSRLEELCWLYMHTKKGVEFLDKSDTILTDLDDTVTISKSSYAKLRSMADKNVLDQKNFLVKALESIKREVEGDRLTIDGKLQMDVEHTINEVIYKDLLTDPTLSILDIVVSRVSARYNLDPRFMMSRLHGSYYSKFNGFNELSNDFNSEVIYPSNVIYDFEKIKKLNKENKKDEKLPPNINIDKDKSEKLKAALLQKLNKLEK